MRYFIDFSYDGTLFSGMQAQKNAISIQEVLEDALRKKIEKEIKITAAGRTDAGVHAHQMIAHFDSQVDFEEIKIKKELNAFLPYSIAVNEIKKVQNSAHARFDALSRTYLYFVTLEKSPFKEKFSHKLPYPDINLVAMNEAANYLLSVQDFTSFAKLHSDNKTNICAVKEAFWIQKNSEIVFQITADRFLRNMVRSIVGTLIDVGKGKINFKRFCEIIELKDRKFASSSAPAKGLFLHAVLYDEKIFI